MKATIIDREGTFTATVVDCIIKTGVRGTFHVIEYRVEGDETLYAELQRVSEHVIEDGPEEGTVVFKTRRPLFKPGDRLRLETKRIKAGRGMSFMHHTWFRPI